MTPKEKAKELVNKFEAPYPYQGLSKDYALTAVDEIQNTKSVYVNDVEYDYWQEVKQEIEKL